MAHICQQAMNNQENYLQGLEEKQAPMNTFSLSADSCIHGVTKTKDDMSDWINLESFLIRDFNIVTKKNDYSIMIRFCSPDVHI